MIFFFNDTATTEIYTLSLHDALPISWDPVDYEERELRRSFRNLVSRIMLDKITLVNSFGVRNRCLTVPRVGNPGRSEEHTSELQSQSNLVCRLLLEKKKTATCSSYVY